MPLIGTLLRLEDWCNRSISIFQGSHISLPYSRWKLVQPGLPSLQIQGRRRLQDACPSCDGALASANNEGIPQGLQVQACEQVCLERRCQRYESRRMTPLLPDQSHIEQAICLGGETLTNTPILQAKFLRKRASARRPISKSCLSSTGETRTSSGS